MNKKEYEISNELISTKQILGEVEEKLRER